MLHAANPADPLLETSDASRAPRPPRPVPLHHPILLLIHSPTLRPPSDPGLDSDSQAFRSRRNIPRPFRIGVPFPSVLFDSLPAWRNLLFDRFSLGRGSANPSSTDQSR